MDISELLRKPGGRRTACQGLELADEMGLVIVAVFGGEVGQIGLGQLTEDDLLLSRADGTPMPVREYSREYAAQRSAVGLPAITLAKLRHSNISRMRAAGVPADVVAAWHGHTERMTQAIYERVTDDRLTAAAGVFSQHLRTGIQR